MCRLAAFPPGFGPKEAFDTVKRFASWNKDGVGTAHIKDGKLVVVKAPTTLEDALKEKVPLFDHMPCRSWTICHFRAASHGKPLMENTHPFVVGAGGEWAFCHNGIWTGYTLAKGLLDLKPKGGTDTEVAALLWDLKGPMGFINLIEDGGVFLALRRTGELWAYVTRGDLAMKKLDDKRVLLASRLDEMDKAHEVDEGWLRFAPDGRLADSKARLSKWTRPTWYGRGNAYHWDGEKYVHDPATYGVGAAGDTPPLPMITIGQGGVVSTPGDAKDEDGYSGLDDTDLGLGGGDCGPKGPFWPRS